MALSAWTVDLALSGATPGFCAASGALLGLLGFDLWFAAAGVARVWVGVPSGVFIVTFPWAAITGPHIHPSIKGNKASGFCQLKMGTRP